MPSKSPAQARLMRAVVHGWKPDRIDGPPVSVAKEFTAADQRKDNPDYRKRLAKALMDDDK